MRYTPAPASLYQRNRAKVSGKLKPGSVLIQHSNDVMPTNADGSMGFRQSSNLLYLSGIDQEETILVLFPDAPSPELREILFIRETNDEILLWEGYKLTKEQAQEASGISNVQWTSAFPRLLKTLMHYAEYVYLDTDEHTRKNTELLSRNDRFIRELMAQYPIHKYERHAPILHAARAIKEPEEVQLIAQACQITEAGFRRLLPFVKPGVMEYEIEAELLHEFVRRGSRGFAYGPIIASGANACVLHYVDNDRPCQAGDVILLDVAAEYGNYASDLTRAIPVSGRYTPRQKDVYNAVLRVHRFAASLLVPGGNLVDYTKQVNEAVQEECLSLGLITSEEVKKQNPAFPAHKKYFNHGVSHHLGLDVHDYGNWYRTFEAGMVFTVEPGLYIREEGLGIRLENNYVIQAEGPAHDLMASIPLEAEEIEGLMNR